MLFCLNITIQSHSYHQSKFFNSSKWAIGTLFDSKSSLTDYFGLQRENQRLVQENESLRLQLLNTTTNPSATAKDAGMLQLYEVISARAIKNNIAAPRNYITINRGETHGVAQDMGVITPLGILGIVENTSAGYATVQSVLNTKSNINAKIKNTNYFGSLVWDANDHQILQLVDIPRSASIMVGDTIATGAMSSIFPEDIPIGLIEKYDLNQNQSSYNIQVRLFNDMANIKNVYVIRNKDRKEILELQNRTDAE
ncbi:MAG: rod shape-determining protein MreC [Bacteroidota bacterium]